MINDLINYVKELCCERSLKILKETKPLFLREEFKLEGETLLERENDLNINSIYIKIFQISK